MQIAYLIPSLANRGPVLVVKDLVYVMTLHGHQCTVFYFDNIHEVTFNCSTRRIGFWEKIMFNDFDVVHSHGIRPDLYVRLNKPANCSAWSVSTLHCFIFNDLRAQYNRIVSFLAGNVWIRLFGRHDRIVVLSEVAREYYTRWILDQNLRVVYNARNIDYRESLLPDEEEEIRSFKGQSALLLGVNALLTPRKGIDLLIKAMPFLENTKLWITGDGKSKVSLQRLAKRLNVSDRIYFAGYKKDAYRYLLYYDVFMMPSRSEGFPLALLEAASSGIPTVCSDLPVFKEIFSREEVSFFKQEDVHSLVEAICLAAGNTGMVCNMRERYQRCYSSEQFYNRYLAVYLRC